MTVRQIRGRFDTVVEVLRAAADVNAEVEAYVEMDAPAAPGIPPAGPDGRRRLTFGAWDAAADGVAWLLAGHGVGRGDVVALLLSSTIDYAICYQAALRLGAVTTGVNLRLGQPEQASIMRRARPAVTVADPALLSEADLPPGHGRLVWRPELWEAAAHAAPVLPSLGASDPVAIVWTSGSTGVPKGAVFDHANLAAVAAGTDVLSRPGDRRLSPLPFAHVGYMTRPWDEIAHAVTTVVTPQPWTAAAAVELLVTEHVTVAQGVPTQWALVLAHPSTVGADLTSLRVAGTGASRVPAELVRAMRARLGCPVVVRYTSTESSLGTGTAPDDPDEVVATTVGRPVAGVELVVAGDDGRPLGTGEVGRVRLRSGAVMRGYLAEHSADGRLVLDGEATTAVLGADRWLTMGDLGWVGDDGNLRLVGRVAEMYIRGGYNVYPAEVEAALCEHPAVVAAAVVGAPDPVLGEIGVAFVVAAGAGPAGTGPGNGADNAAGAGTPAPTLEELRTWCRARLADYKAPDRLVTVGELPLTAMAKVDKQSLRALAERELELELEAGPVQSRSRVPGTRGA
jgi:acyl-CoA synthetase (AMP-forming)/AMP-acid ligase II